MSGFFKRFVNEHCLPVVLTISSAEVDETCLRNTGMLLNELLNAACGEMDGAADGETERSSERGSVDGKSSCSMRYERSSEAKAKTFRLIEQRLSCADIFSEFPLSKLTSQIRPTAWSEPVESLLLKSMAFSEAETLSAPIVLLYAVSTNDFDPIASMAELTNFYHSPDCFKSGQYDPTVFKLYVLVHDANSNSEETIDKYKRLEPQFSSKNAKVLVINTLCTPSTWTKTPLFFPQSTPYENIFDGSPGKIVLPKDNTWNLQRQSSAGDFSIVYKFCLELYTFIVLPELEKRVDMLSKHVADHRKGVKNVLRSFWRKPKDSSSESSPGGPSNAADNAVEGVRYRFDSSEGQTMLLADTLFIMKDYEAAYNTYRMLKEDFKSDKSLYHYGHICVMMAVCQVCIEPKYGGRDLHLTIGAFRETCLNSAVGVSALIDQEFAESASSVVFLSLLAASIFSAPTQGPSRAPVEAAHLLLTAAYHTRHSAMMKVKSVGGEVLPSPFPLLTALLTERAAQFFSLAKYNRKCAFYTATSSYLYLHSCPGVVGAKEHAITSFAAVSCTASGEGWVELETRMLAIIVDQYSKSGDWDKQVRSLLLTLYALTRLRRKGERVSSEIAVTGVKTVHPAYFSSKMSKSIEGLYSISENLRGISVTSKWKDMSILQILQKELPLVEGTTEQLIVSIEDFCVPSISYMGKSAPTIITPVNGIKDMFSKEHDENVFQEISRQLTSIEIELDLDKHGISKLIDLFAGSAGTPGTETKNLFSLNERINVRMTLMNPLGVPLSVSDIQLVLGQFIEDKKHKTEEFSEKIDIVLSPYDRKEIVLSVYPPSVGYYSICGIKWRLGQTVHVTNTFEKQGRLKLKTLADRAARAREEDSSLLFEVEGPCPLLTLSISHLEEKVYSGEVVRAVLSIRNDGGSAAHHIALRVQGALCVLSLVSGELLGAADTPSASLFPLALDLVPSLVPGSTLQLIAWLQFKSHSALNLDGYNNFSIVAYTNMNQSDLRRVSYLAKRVEVQPYISLNLRNKDLPSSTALQFLQFVVENKGTDPCTLEGLQSLGEVRNTKYLSKMSVSQRRVESTRNILFSLLMECNEQSAMSNEKSSKDGWISPIQMNSDSESTYQYFNIIERLQCASYQQRYFAKLVIDAVRSNAGEGVPRTIVQVRKERDQLRSSLGGFTGNNGLEKTNGSDNGGNKYTVFNSNVDISSEMNRRNKVMYALFWSVESSSDLPRIGFSTCVFSAPAVIHSIDNEDIVGKPLADSVFIVIRPTPDTYYRSESCKCNAEVVVELKSEYHETVVCSVNALSSTSDGIYWENKSKYQHILLMQGTSLNLPFMASVVKPGVFDISKLFVVQLSATNEEVSVEVRGIQGASLLVVNNS